MIGNGAAICNTQQAARGESRLNASGQRGGESEVGGGLVRPSSCPTQAKERLEWATSLLIFVSTVYDVKPILTGSF
jgi:hypothetical protein